MKLAPVFLGSLARRRAATLFSFIAIVLGVALGMAVQAVHEAALGELRRVEYNIESAAGKILEAAALTYVGQSLMALLNIAAWVRFLRR